MSAASPPQDSSVTKRLAIIGGGSSGLVTLKYALDELPDWEILCFEKSNDVTGCWGRPPKGFISTSTKYATQFACFAKYDVQMHRNEANPFADFFQDGEYGDYLLEFVNAFDLDRHIIRNCKVQAANRESNGHWKLDFEDRASELFSHVIICTGLADQPKPINDCPIPVLQTVAQAGKVKNKRIVVVGGGESAVDIANRVSNPELGNQVFLSLRSGVRVSPRYHPIRGVPSDFLRTRLLLANHPDVRNSIGQKFVEFRIKSTNWLQWLFPANSSNPNSDSDSEAAIRKRWDMKLTRASKDRLFNVYHNKSDDFLNSVARGQIKIIGTNVDDQYREFFEFQSQEILEVNPELMVPAIGYRSTLSAILGDRVSFQQFFMGCLHTEIENLGAVGFTRPIIGNIPSISEMQARYLCGIFAGRFARPKMAGKINRVNRRQLEWQYPELDCQRVYPVEMFPYCDELARLMGCFPSFKSIGLWKWWRMMRAPATTMHYFEDARSKPAPVHSPPLITLLLVLAKPIDAAYRVFRFIWPKRF